MTAAKKTLRKILTKEIAETRKELLAIQGGICPICSREITDPVLDHDHKTEAVRDTLCRNCNRVEGKILHWVRTASRGEDVNFLRSVASYWIRHKVNRHGLLHPGRPKRKKKRKTKRSIKNATT